MKTATSTSHKNTRRAPTEAQKATARQRRNELKALSDLLKPHRAADQPMNELILAYYQAQTGQSDFRSFPAWKAEGCAPRKGEKGFPVWGRPRAIRGGEAGADAQTAEELQPTEDGKAEFFPLAYLFHSGQVAPIGHKDPAPAPPAADPDQDPADLDPEQCQLFSEIIQ